MSNLNQIVELDTKRRLRELLREKERRRGLEDLHYFCKEIIDYSDLTDADGFHGEYCRHIEGPKKLKLTLTPRGSLKTSIGTVGHPIQLAVKDPNIRILIASKKYTVATGILGEIIGHFEHNERFRDLYGDLVGKKGDWSSTEITINTRTRIRVSPTISCEEIDVTNTGLHYDYIKVYDPLDHLNTSSREQIDKVIRWYRLLYSLLDPGGHMDITGTIWHYADLYNHIRNKERERKQKGLKKKFSIFIRDSFEGTNEELINDQITKDKLLWPERLSAEFLKETYIEQGPYIFSCQYRLNPVDDENAAFKKSWVKLIHPNK